MSFIRLIMLLHLMIFGGLGAGIGFLIGYPEICAVIGAVLGVALSFPAMDRFDKMVERGQRKLPGKIRPR